MTQTEDMLISLVAEAIRVIVILEYFKIFFDIRSIKTSIFNGIVTYIITLATYLFFHNVFVNLLVTILGIIFLSLGFEGKIKKKILLSLMIYAIMFVIDLLAAFLLYEAPDSNNYDIVSQFISVMFFYIAVIAMKKIFKNKGKYDFSGQ